MQRKIISMILILLFCLGLTGCDKSKGNSAEKQKEDQKQADSTKFNAYVALNNFMVGELEDVLDDYLKRLGTDQEPKIEKNFNYYPNSIAEYNNETIKNAYKYSSQNPEYQEVDSAMKELYPKLTELVGLLKDAHNYYELKNYVDDNFAKGKELHVKILKCYSEYKPLHSNFTSSIKVIAHELVNKEMEQLKKDDKMMRYYCKSVLMRAEELQIELENQKITSRNLLDLDLATYKEKYNLLASDIEKVLEYSKDDARVEKEKMPIHSAYYDSYLSDIKNLKIAATEIIERVQAKREFDKYELNDSFLSTRKGSLEKFDRQLSRTIHDYNNLK